PDRRKQEALRPDSGSTEAGLETHRGGAQEAPRPDPGSAWPALLIQRDWRQPRTAAGQNAASAADRKPGFVRVASPDGAPAISGRPRWRIAAFSAASASSASIGSAPFCFDNFSPS